MSEIPVRAEPTGREPTPPGWALTDTPLEWLKWAFRAHPARDGRLALLGSGYLGAHESPGGTSTSPGRRGLNRQAQPTRPVPYTNWPTPSASRPAETALVPSGPAPAWAPLTTIYRVSLEP